MTELSEFDIEMTLDPPGRIAVIGAGPLGLEAALYGRFLGYDVTVFECGEVGQALRLCPDKPLPMLPSDCLSALARSAIETQRGGIGALVGPVTIGQWLRDAIEPLADTDLLRGRVLTGHRVLAIEPVEVLLDDDAVGTSDGDYEIDEDIPPDFRIWFEGVASVTDADSALADEGGDSRQAAEFEAVIVAIGAREISSVTGLGGCLESPYCFRVGGSASSVAPSPAGETSLSEESAAARRLAEGRVEIVKIFAGLGGRAGLDLYRPLRL